jgi:hypothetical protein
VSRTEVYKVKTGTWFTSNAHLGKSVSDDLFLSTLTKVKYELYLRDEKFTLGEEAAREVEVTDVKSTIKVAGVMGEKSDMLNGWYETTDVHNTSDKDLNNTDGCRVSVETDKDLPMRVDRWKT